MIETECAVFLALFAWGIAAGIAASCLNVLGCASSFARALFDALIAFSVAALFFFGHYFAADGEMRLYSAAAFALGVFLSTRFSAAVYPHLKRLLSRLISPLLSLEEKCKKSLETRFSPLLEKRKEIAKRAAEKRAAKRNARKDKNYRKGKMRRVGRKTRIEE